MEWPPLLDEVDVELLPEVELEVELEVLDEVELDVLDEELTLPDELDEVDE